MLDNKKCGVCEEIKPIEFFEQRAGQPTYRCKECVKKYFKEYYKKNKNKIKERSKEWRKENLDKSRKWEEENKEHRKKWKKEWIDKNREKINTAERERRKTDISYKVKKNLRRRVNDVVNKKAGKTMELVGCSLLALLKHLEKNFVEGMTWENYGEWHIDHIIPCASFDLTVEEEQKKCFHYSNLQPLWGIDNLKKGDKIL